MYTKGGGKRGRTVADTNVALFAPARNICSGHKLLCPRHKNVSNFGFADMSLVSPSKKHQEQQCV